LCRYYAAFPSLSDKCDLLAGTGCSSPVEPAWSRIAQTHPKVAEDTKVIAMDSGVNSAHDDSPVDDGRPFRGNSGSGNFPGNHRRHRKPRGHDDGRRRKPGQRRSRCEWSGGGERNVWPASICGLPWLYDGGRMPYWPLQPSFAGFSQPTMTIAGDDWSFPESYKDRFSDLASSEWTRPSHEEERADAAERSSGIVRRSNQDIVYIEPVRDIASPHDRNTAELGNNCVTSTTEDTEPADNDVSSKCRCVTDAGVLASESLETRSSISVSDRQAVVADFLTDDLGNSLSPHEVCLSVLQSGGFALTLDADPRSTGGSGIAPDDNDPFLGCRPFDPALWSILNSARMWCSDSSLSRELRLVPQSSERDSLLNVGFHLFELDSSNDWSDIESVIDCSGCLDASDTFSLPCLQDDRHNNVEMLPDNDGLNSVDYWPVDSVDRLMCAETLGNEVWDGSRIAEALLENDAVVTVLDAEAVRQIWQPGSCSSVDSIDLSNCEADSDTHNTIYHQLSHSHCETDKTAASDSCVEAELDGCCAHEFSHWNNRCHCVRCIWQCELLSADVSEAPSWTSDIATQESNSRTDGNNQIHGVSSLAPSANPSSVFWSEVHEDCERIKASLMWDSQLFSLDLLGPSSVDSSSAARSENTKNFADCQEFAALMGDMVVESDESLFGDLLAVKTRRWFSLLRSQQDEMKDLVDNTHRQEQSTCGDSKCNFDDNSSEKQQTYDLLCTTHDITGSSTETDETRKFFNSSATEVEQSLSHGATVAVDGRDEELTASASVSSDCGACSSTHQLSSILADLLEENNNVSCCVAGATVMAGSEEMVQQLPSLGSVSDIVFSDTEDSSDSDLSSASSVFDVSVFSSPEPSDDDPVTLESGSLKVLGSAFDRVFHLDFGSDLRSAAQCYIGSFLAPLYALDGSSLWFRDSHYISANADALSRLHSGMAPLPTWLPSTSVAHQSVCTALARSNCLLPSENTAFRDSIPQRVEPVARSESVTNALAHPLVHQYSACAFSPWLSQPRLPEESLSLQVITNRHQFRPIGTPSTTDSDQSEASTATTEAVTTTEDSLSDFAALVMADMLVDPHGTYQRFVDGREFDGEDENDCDDGVGRRRFQPSFKVQCELEKAAQTGESSPPTSLNASADLQLGCLVKQVLSQLSGEFPEASNNLDDILCGAAASDISCPEEQNADEASVAMSRRLSVIWSDTADAGAIGLDSRLPCTSEVSSQVSHIWTDSVTTDTSSPSFVTIHDRQLSDIWSDTTAQLADSAYVSDTAELQSSSVSDADRQTTWPKADGLRRMWKSVDLDDTFAMSDGRLFKPSSSIWNQSRPSSATPEAETLRCVLEDGALDVVQRDSESASTDEHSDECDVSPSELDMFWRATSEDKSPTNTTGADDESYSDGRTFHGGGLSNSLMGNDNIWSCSDAEVHGSECGEVNTSWNVDPLYCSGSQISSILPAVISGGSVPPDSIVSLPSLWTSSESNVDADVAFAFTHLVSGVVSIMLFVFIFSCSSV